MLDAGPGNPKQHSGTREPHRWGKGPGPGLESCGGEPRGRGSGDRSLESGPLSEARDQDPQPHGSQSGVFSLRHDRNSWVCTLNTV